jgi:hypothetical protein
MERAATIDFTKAQDRVKSVAASINCEGATMPTLRQSQLECGGSSGSLRHFAHALH